jgi:thymidylate synthase (FAD)
MKFLDPSYQILTKLDGKEILKSIEIAGRTAYKSEDRITDNSANNFIELLIKRGHLSVIEHQSFSVRFIVDRGISHEIVRHRLASFTQESTRYCNYSKDKFGNELNFIRPIFWDGCPESDEDCEKHAILEETLLHIEKSYSKLIKLGALPQEARSILPNILKTEIVVTANLREWRVIFKQRTAKTAHPQIREVMQPLLDEIKMLIPVIFDDINYE